jgi:uncharacterized protein
MVAQGLTRQERLDSALQVLYEKVAGIKAIVIVNNDGLLVAAYPPDDEEADINPTNSPQVAAMAATMIGLAQKTLSRLAQGSMERLLMEGEEGVMVFFPAGRASLAVLAEKDARMAYILYATRDAATEIAKILGY